MNQLSTEFPLFSVILSLAQKVKISQNEGYMA